MTLARHALQWLAFYVGLLLHAFSFWTIRSDPDTAYDWHRNMQLDRLDADGHRSDGVEEAWDRFLHDGWRKRIHNAKNYPREVYEIWHPKTSARVSGAIALGSLLAGVAIGQLI